MEPEVRDAQLITSLGGPAKVARLLNLDGAGVGDGARLHGASVVHGGPAC